MKKISEIIVVALIEKSVISEEDKEIYLYGLNGLLILGLNLLTILGFSIIFGITEYILWVLLFFVPIRIYAGGLHLSNKWLCWAASNIAIFLSFFLVNETTEIVKILIFLSGLFIISIVGPIENKSHILDVHEYKRYKKILLMISISYCIIGFALLAIEFSRLFTCLCVAIFLSGLLAILGLIEGALLYRFK